MTAATLEYAIPTTHAALVQLDQGSQEWLDWRAARYTASQAPAVMAANPWVPRTPYQLYQVRTGQLQVFVNAAMRAGNADEPRIRALVEMAYGATLVPACFQLSVGELELGASLDAVDLLMGEAWELKRPAKGSASDLWTAKETPEHYLWQLVHQLLTVPQLSRVHLVAYAHDMDAIRVVDTLERDSARFRDSAEQLLDAWRAFHDSLANLAPPPVTDRDVVELDAKDKEYADAMLAYCTAAEATEAWNQKLEESRARLLELAQQRGGGCKVVGLGASIYSSTRNGNVNWKAKPITDALKAAGVNPEDYRGKAVTSWTIKLANKGAEA